MKKISLLILSITIYSVGLLYGQDQAIKNLNSNEPTVCECLNVIKQMGDYNKKLSRSEYKIKRKKLAAIVIPCEVILASLDKDLKLLTTEKKKEKEAALMKECEGQKNVDLEKLATKYSKYTFPKPKYTYCEAVKLDKKHGEIVRNFDTYEKKAQWKKENAEDIYQIKLARLKLEYDMSKLSGKEAELLKEKELKKCD